MKFYWKIKINKNKKKFIKLIKIKKVFALI
jgi:hypothetical protein